MKKVVPFDTEKAKNGAKIVTRLGHLFIEEEMENNDPTTTLGYTVQPKTKEELEEIIEKTIKEKGDHCDLNFIDTSLITDMSKLFMGTDFDGDISKWDTSNVQNMVEMFSASRFNGDISKWDVSNVKSMNAMFCESLGFDGDISNWDVSNVEDMDLMFWASYFDKDISNWDVSKVREMRYMFAESNFNQDISKWNVSKNAFVYKMFDRTYLEENNNLPDWYVYHPNKD